MNLRNDNIFGDSIAQAQQGTIAKTFLSNVFMFMLMALGISSVLAYYVGTDIELLTLIYTTPLKWVAFLGPLALVFLMAGRFSKMSSQTLLIVFILYSVLMGVSLASIVAVYSPMAIVKTLGITAVTFGTMAVLGYTTKTDLSKMGTYLIMALIGIIIASVVNFFLNSDSLDYLISIGGVIIFTGLTAYDMQKLKQIGGSLTSYDNDASKLAIMGALNLYLDFVNLFLFLLRIFGSRD